MNIESLTFTAPKGTLRHLKRLTVAGLIVAIVGICFEWFNVANRIWPNLLLSTVYLLSVGLGALLFIMFQYLTKAGWATVFRRVPEAMTAVLPVCALFMIVIFMGMGSLYEWSHQDVVRSDHLLQHKTWWLNVPGYMIRTVVYLALWIVAARLIVGASQRQDRTADLNCTRLNLRRSALFMVLFAVSISLAGFDWIMSLEPHWYSTIFSVYLFSGIFLTGLAAVTVVVIIVRRLGPFQTVISEAHLHDLGKLIFSFSTFWMYIWLSQYVLIWYSNIPEETTYFLKRNAGPWETLGLLNIILNWVIPFFVLMPRKTKQNETILLQVAVVVMIGHWLDLYLMILPSFTGELPAFGIWELFPFAGAVALFFQICFLTLEKSKLIPVNDPRLSESLHHGT